MKKLFIGSAIIVVLLIILSIYLFYPSSSEQKDIRFYQDPKFCIEETDCISYTYCGSEYEPRNKYYDNSLTPDYSPNQKCSPDSTAYIGSDVKCENNKCEYRWCHAECELENNLGSESGGLTLCDNNVLTCTGFKT